MVTLNSRCICLSYILTNLEYIRAQAKVYFFTPLNIKESNECLNQVFVSEQKFWDQFTLIKSKLNKQENPSYEVFIAFPSSPSIEKDKEQVYMYFCREHTFSRLLSLLLHLYFLTSLLVVNYMPPVTELIAGKKSECLVLTEEFLNHLQS